MSKNLGTVFSWKDYFDRDVTGRGQPSLLPAFQSAKEGFLRQGFPVAKSEAWKYSSPESFYSGVHGVSEPSHFLAPQARQGLRILSLKGEALPQWVEEALTQVTRLQPDGFSQLALALASSGLFLEVEPKCNMSGEPLRIDLKLEQQQNRVSLVPSAVFLKVGAGSRVEWVTDNLFDNPSEQAFTSLSNQIFVVVLEEHAELSWVDFRRLAQVKDLSHWVVLQAAHSRLDLTSFKLNSQLCRHRIDVVQMGRKALTQVHTLALAAAKDHVDHRVRVEHLHADGESRLILKSIVASQGRAISNPQTFIAKGAQKTDAYQLSQNLLLGTHGEVDTKPELEVQADDVKASHGASIGRLNLEEMFYMMSRGLSQEESLKALAHAFVDEMVLRLPPSLKKTSETFVAQSLARFSAQGLGLL